MFEGMLNQYGWVSQEIKRDPLTAIHENHTAGPKPLSTRGKRAIVIGSMSSTKILMRTCKIFRGYTKIKKLTIK